MADTNIKKNADGYGYKYTDLAEIHNYLESINARYIQQVQRIEGEDYIFTKRCFADKWENEWLQGCRVVQATLQGIKNPAQEQGSALTYARRYSVLMAFGLATTDDDAQSLTQDTKKSKAENKKEPTWRDKVLALAKELGLDLKALAQDYELTRTTPEEKYEKVYKELLTMKESK